VLPVKAQINRLETLLEGEGMLTGGTLTPAGAEPSENVRAAITDAVDYLAYADDAKLPDWFDKDFTESSVFRSKFGFAKTWVGLDDDNNSDDGQYLGTYLYLPSGTVDISDFDWALNPEAYYGKDESAYITVEGKRAAIRFIGQRRATVCRHCASCWTTKLSLSRTCTNI
jgi:hypothetical protein